jgi:hypothetical protein
VYQTLVQLSSPRKRRSYRYANRAEMTLRPGIHEVRGSEETLCVHWATSPSIGYRARHCYPLLAVLGIEQTATVPACPARLRPRAPSLPSRANRLGSRPGSGADRPSRPTLPLRLPAPGRDRDAPQRRAPAPDPAPDARNDVVRVRRSSSTRAEQSATPSPGTSGAACGDV